MTHVASTLIVGLAVQASQGRPQVSLRTRLCELAVGTIGLSNQLEFAGLQIGPIL